MPSYVIVGASRGLGYEWLRQLSKDPANIVFGVVRSVDKTQAQVTADKLSNVHIIRGDMVDSASLEQAALEISRISQGIDYLIVNGANLSPETSALQPSEFSTRSSQLRQGMIESLDVNVVGVMYSINSFLPLVRKGTAKKITVISTGMADSDAVTSVGINGSVIYAAMKSATNMVVAKYSVELEEEGIIIFALSPGVVNTQEEILSEEQMNGMKLLFQKFQTAYPDFKGPIPAAESVLMQKKVIDDITLDRTGAFISHKGDKTWL